MGEVSATAISVSGMQAQAQRLRHVSENIANVDTPGYRRKTISFEPERQDGRLTGGVEASRAHLDQTQLPQVFDPAHPMAGDDGFYLGSNVDLVVEIADSREASRSYEANLRVFEQSRQMNNNLLELLRR